jgi:hypothetical protein
MQIHFELSFFPQVLYPESKVHLFFSPYSIGIVFRNNNHIAVTMARTTKK